MTPEELRLRRVRSFRELAASELEAAKMLATVYRGQAAYLLQQCVEKLARGILEVEDTKAGPTHNIGQLAQLMSTEGEFVKRFRELDELSPAATRYRYPGPSGEVRSISKERLHELLMAVEKLNSDVGNFLSAHTDRTDAQ